MFESHSNYNVYIVLLILSTQEEILRNNIHKILKQNLTNTH